MSVKMVSRYLRFADKVESGRASRDRREQRQAEFANTAAHLQSAKMLKDRGFQKTYLTAH
jgi:hypothetical protein